MELIMKISHEIWNIIVWHDLWKSSPPTWKETIWNYKNWYCAAPKPTCRLETLAKWWNLKTLAVVRIFFLFFILSNNTTLKEREKEKYDTSFFFFVWITPRTQNRKLWRKTQTKKNAKQETVKKNACSTDYER